MDFDCIIIGGGVVGLAVAAKLSRNHFNCALLERHSSFGCETSSRNSEVIHAGMYYPENSLKAKLCVAGNRSLRQYCRENNIPFSRTGKFIISRNQNEDQLLDGIIIQANANGVENISRVGREFLLKAEPCVNAYSALLSKDTSIIDTHSLMNCLFEEARQNGCDFAFRHEVVGLDFAQNKIFVYIKTRSSDEFKISAKYVINCAGLDSDTIARKAGIDVDAEKLKLHFAKGHYFRINAASGLSFNHLIYPVPQKNSAGLGIHLTLDLAGGMKLGPDVKYLHTKQQDYNVPENLHQAFYEAASSYIPDLKPEHISADQSGIRPKLQAEGDAFQDFYIADESHRSLNGFINLIGIESPGLTSSLEIAKSVFQLI